MIQFGLFKKKYTKLEPNIIEPANEPISTANAKRIFKDFMGQIGFLEKDELSLHATYLGEDIRDHESSLREDIESAKEEVRDANAELKALRAKVRAKDYDDLEELEDEIACAEEDLQSVQEELEEQKDELAQFRADKRLFLVDYINSQTQAD